MAGMKGIRKMVVGDLKICEEINHLPEDSRPHLDPCRTFQSCGSEIRTRSMTVLLLSPKVPSHWEREKTEN